MALFGSGCRLWRCSLHNLCTITQRQQDFYEPWCHRHWSHINLTWWSTHNTDKTIIHKLIKPILLVDDPRKTIDLPDVTDKPYHIMLYTVPWSRFELTTSVVICTACIGSCKSYYHTITTMPVLIYNVCAVKYWIKQTWEAGFGKNK